MRCVTIPERAPPAFPAEVTLVIIIYLDLRFIVRRTHIAVACVVLLWFVIMNFHKEITEVV